MKSLLKRSLAVACSAGLLLGLSACTGGGGSAASGDEGSMKGEITFQTWSLKNDRFTPYFENLIAEFEKANPGAKVKWIDQPGEGYEEKVLQQANAGELPDVINLPPEYAYQLAQAGKLEDLAKADSAVLESYVKGGTEGYTFPDVGGTYGYAWYLGTDVNWWNTKMIKDAGLDPNKLPTTWDELFTMADEMAQKSNGELKMISETPRMGTLATAGIPIFKDGKFVFATDEAAAFVQKYVDAYKAGAMPPEALSGDWLGNSAAYKQGKVAWTTASGGFASELSKEAPSLLEVTKVTPRIGKSPLFLQALSVSAESKHKALALKFAQFATNNENQVAFVKIAQGFFPGQQEANDNPESFTSVIENPVQKEATELAAKSIGNAFMENPVQYTQKMGDYFNQQIALAVRGDITPKEALQKAQDMANGELK